MPGLDDLCVCSNDQLSTSKTCIIHNEEYFRVYVIDLLEQLSEEIKEVKDAAL